MTSKGLYRWSLATILFDIAGGHLVYFSKWLPQDADYYLYNINLAIVLWCLYLRVSYQFESVNNGLHLVQDKYITRTNYIFFVMMPFASKQILDAVLLRYDLDIFDYPVLIIMMVWGWKKYYYLKPTD